MVGASDLRAAYRNARRKGESLAQTFNGDTVAGRAAQTGTVLTVVTLGITILVGILIYSQIQSSLPTPQNTQLSEASSNATDTFAQSMELAPVIMIVLLAAVVLAVVQRFR
jgi:uncharacterized membrane protein